MKNKLHLIIALIMIATACNGAVTGCESNDKKPVSGPIIDGEEAYHVIVAGGEPEGVAAALAAARNGVKALLVEEGDALGGLMTLGMLNFLDQNHGPGRILLTQGIFREFYMALGNAFDIEEAKDWFLKTCNNEPNLTVMLNTEILAPVMDGNAIIGLEVKEKYGSSSHIIRSFAVIDATADGDIAAASGAPYTVGGEDYGAHGRKQGVTLVFEVAGVDWESVGRHINNDGNPGTSANNSAARGYNEEVRNFTPIDSDMRFRAPNIAQLHNKNVLINGLIIFGVDVHDPDSYAEGIERGMQEIPHIIEYMRNNFPGFENASYVRHAPRLYVRETRHFIGEYRLTITDVLENRDHWDRIGHGSYPVDIQATNANSTGNVIGVPEIYSIPFRCLVPLEIEGLLIASRSASYDSIPHGSTRVIPVGMVAGEACGVAVAYSVAHDVSFRQMTRDPDAILWLQNTLIRGGAFLVEYEPPRIAAMDHWAYDGMAVMRELGMAAGGYSNNYRLDVELEHRWALQNRLNRLMSLVNERTADRGELRIPAWYVRLRTDTITVGHLLISVAQCLSMGDHDRIRASSERNGEPMTPLEFADAKEAMDYLIDRGVLDTKLLQHYADTEARVTMGQLHSILGALYTTLMGNGFL